jgi:TonB family protein
MNRICWWLVQQASRLLKSNQREAVLGDIAESGESAEMALYEVLGLIVRQLAASRKEVRMSKPRLIASSVIPVAVLVAAGWWAVSTFWLTALPGSPVRITGYVYASSGPESNSASTFMYYVPNDAHARSWLRKSGGAQIKGPVPISMPGPPYTPQAKKDKVKGAIVALVDVDAGGNVTGVRLTTLSLSRNLTDGLGQSVIDTVHTWKFRPATENGKPLPVTVHVQVNFSLS